MTKKQLLRARRPRRQGKQRRFRGWFWENPLRERRPGERTFIGKCHNKQGIMLLIPFHATPVPNGPVDRCRHCGGEYDSVRAA